MGRGRLAFLLPFGGGDRLQHLLGAWWSKAPFRGVRWHRPRLYEASLAVERMSFATCAMVRAFDMECIDACFRAVMQMARVSVL